MGAIKKYCDKAQIFRSLGAPMIFSPTVVFTQFIDLSYKYLFKISQSLKTSLNLIDQFIIGFKFQTVRMDIHNK